MGKKDRSIRKKTKEGKSVFAGSRPDPKSLHPSNTDNLVLTSAGSTTVEDEMNKVPTWDDVKDIYNTLTALDPIHPAPSDLIATDTQGWYPDNADPQVISDLRNLSTRLIVIDTETTGFRPEEGAQVTEICWYSLNSGYGGTFIPPHTLEGADEKSLEISRYHERLAGKPQDDGKQVAALHAFLGGDGARVHIVGSNPAFDALHLGELFKKHGLSPTPWNHRLIDPCAASYWQDPDAPFGTPTGLKESAAASDVDIEGHHAARVDVAATVGVYHHLEARRRRMPVMTR